MRTPLYTLLTALIILAAGCAGSRSTVSEHPMEGEWTYEVEADDGIYEGVLSFEATDEGLTGTITGDGVDVAVELMDVAYEDGRLSFEFETPEYGLLIADLEVDGDTYAGELEVTSYGAYAPMSGERIYPE